jgi:hypothetical protein
MNSNLGLLWVRVGYAMGEREFFTHDVLLFSDSLRHLANRILQLTTSQVGEAYFDHTGSPELSIKLCHPWWNDKEYAAELAAAGVEPEPDFSIEIELSVDIGIAAGEKYVGNGGPAMHLQARASRLAEFGRDLRAETELALVEFDLN